MIKSRIIPMLLLKGGSIVKTVKFKDPRIVGDPVSTIRVFANRMADELCIVDIGDNDKHNMTQLKNLASLANMPLTIGGKILSTDTAKRLYEIGADKLMLRSLIYESPKKVREIANIYGRQSVVFCLDYINHEKKNISIYGKQNTKMGGSVLDIFSKAEELGVGEIFLNNVSLEGTMSGYDLDLINNISSKSSIPIIASGGCGSLKNALDAFRAGANAISAGSLFYWVGESIITLKDYLKKNNINIRVK